MIYSFLFLIGAVLVNIWNAVASPPLFLVILYYAVLIFALVASFLAEVRKHGS